MHRRSELRIARIGGADRGPPCLEIKHGRDPVARMQTTARQRLRVAVQVDEPGSDDLSTDLDDRVTVQWFARDGRNLPAGDAHVAHVVDPTLRVDHPATSQHHVVAGHARAA